jgi:hypothetical protein
MAEWRMEIVALDGKQKKVCVIEADGLNQAKRKALQEFRVLVPEKKNLYLESKSPGLYSIVSDLYDVGEVALERTDR